MIALKLTVAVISLQEIGCGIVAADKNENFSVSSGLLSESLRSAAAIWGFGWK